MTKRDLIDAVREGASIEIYEGVPLLKEGDVLEDWTDSADQISLNVTIQFRYVVGKKGSLLVKNCKWCHEKYYQRVVERKYTRKGRDGRSYSTIERKIKGYICPRCGNIESYYEARW